MLSTVMLALGLYLAPSLGARAASSATLSRTRGPPPLPKKPRRRENENPLANLCGDFKGL
jgi:hypothetical protein